MKYPRILYAIKHNKTKRIFIGTTAQSLEDRYRFHIAALRKHRHHTSLMQEDFDKYGEDFSVYILGKLETKDDRDMEYEAILKYKTCDEKYGYNKTRLPNKNDVVMNLKESLDDLDEH